MQRRQTHPGRFARDRHEVTAFLLGFLIPGVAAIELPLVIVQAGHRPFRVGAVLALQNAGIMLAPLWGLFADRQRSARAASLPGYAALLVGFGLFAGCRGLDALLLAGFFLGTGYGAAQTGLALAVARRGAMAAFGRMQLAAAIGMAGGFFAAATLLAHDAMLAAAFVTVTGDALALARRERVADATLRVKPPAIRMRRFALSLAMTWLLFSVAVALFASQYTLVMARSFGVGRHAASLAMAMGTLVGLPLYALAARARTQRTVARFVLGGFVVRASSLAALALLARADGSSPTAPLLVATLFQAIWPLIGVGATEIAASVTPKSQGFAIGAMNGIGALARAIGALVAGVVAERFGYPAVLVAATTLSTLSVTGLALSALGKRPNLLLGMT